MDSLLSQSLIDEQKKKQKTDIQTGQGHSFCFIEYPLLTIPTFVSSTRFHEIIIPRSKTYKSPIKGYDWKEAYKQIYRHISAYTCTHCHIRILIYMHIFTYLYKE